MFDRLLTGTARRSTRRALVLAGTTAAGAVALVGVTGPAAWALTAEANATFGIGPASDQAVDGRPVLNYVVTPGARLNDHIAVVNISAEPLTVAVYATDVVPGTNGQADLPPAGVTATDAGSWVSLAIDDPAKQVTVAPRSTLVVPILISVPASASPGDHAAGIVASLTTDARNEHGDVVHVDQRVAVRAYIRVGGELEPRLDVEELDAQYEQNPNPLGTGNVIVHYRVRNTGNVKLGGRQRVDFTGLLRTTHGPQALADIPVLLPGGSIGASTELDGVPPEVVGSAGVHVTPQPAPGDVDPALPGVETSTRVWAIPLAFAVLVALGALIVVLVRRRRRDDDTDGEPPAPVAAGARAEARS